MTMIERPSVIAAAIIRQFRHEGQDLANACVTILAATLIAQCDTEDEVRTGAEAISADIREMAGSHLS